MEKASLINALAKKLPRNLAEDLVNEFLQIRQDVSTNTLGRSSSGKFVETVVQVCQYLDTNTYDDPPPKPDNYFNNLESRSSNLDDGIRICAARIGRAMYTLRNKRNMQHKGSVDPNSYDLRFSLHGAQWLLSELLRSVSGLTMQAAGQLINLVNAPVGGLVEDLSGRRLVLLNDLEIPEEILILLHSQYGTIVSLADIFNSLNRRGQKQIRNALRSLWNRKMIDGNTKDGYQLTSKGFDIAVDLIHEETKNR